MTLRSALLAVCLTPAWLLAGPPAHAGKNDILAGLDAKIACDANGSHKLAARTPC